MQGIKEISEESRRTNCFRVANFLSRQFSPYFLCSAFRDKVEICRHGCLDHCQLSGSVAHYIQERKDQIRPQYTQITPSPIDDDNSSVDRDSEDAGGSVEHGDVSLYEDVIQNGDEASLGDHFLDVEKPIPKAQAQTSDRLSPTAAEPQHDSQVHSDNDDLSKPFMVNASTVYSVARQFPDYKLRELRFLENQVSGAQLSNNKTVISFGRFHLIFRYNLSLEKMHRVNFEAKKNQKYKRSQKLYHSLPAFRNRRA